LIHVYAKYYAISMPVFPLDGVIKTTTGEAVVIDNSCHNSKFTAV